MPSLAERNADLVRRPSLTEAGSRGQLVPQTGSGGRGVVPPSNGGVATQTPGGSNALYGRGGNSLPAVRGGSGVPARGMDLPVGSGLAAGASRLNPALAAGAVALTPSELNRGEDAELDRLGLRPDSVARPSWDESSAPTRRSDQRPHDPHVLQGYVFGNSQNRFLVTPLPGQNPRQAEASGPPVDLQPQRQAPQEQPQPAREAPTRSVWTGRESLAGSVDASHDYKKGGLVQNGRPAPKPTAKAAPKAPSKPAVKAVAKRATPTAKRVAKPPVRASKAPVKATAKRK